jgi:hypothetical protein
MEPIGYQTMDWADDAARMLTQLNQLGAQGWEVCAQGHARTGNVVIGRVSPKHESQVLVLKRRKEA